MYTSHNNQSLQDQNCCLEEETESLIVDLDTSLADMSGLTSSLNNQKSSPQPFIEEVREDLFDILLRLQQKSNPWLSQNR